MSLDDLGLSALRRDLVSWWPKVRRERDLLPWRATRDPWAVLVSESMLSQTQVGRVASRFSEVLERFPTPAALACSEQGEIVRLWSGLGYNRRAVALRRAAECLVERHGGDVPSRLEDLEALPGVGPYTARAVLAYAFDAPVAAVDANVARVLARAVSGSPLGRSDAQLVADRLVANRPGREWNLALVDFGSLVCRSRSPLCGECPVRSSCTWRTSTVGTEDPARSSAFTSRTQARFAGSDREGRGRLMRAACEGAIGAGSVAETAGWPTDPARAERAARALVAEGLLVRDADESLRLG